LTSATRASASSKTEKASSTFGHLAHGVIVAGLAGSRQ
jgi:hypothetical protein